MALQSIVDIEINAQKFKDFLTQFNKYRVALEKMPKYWQQAGKDQRASIPLTERLANTMAQHARSGEALAASGDKWREGLVRTERIWSSMERSTKSLSSNIIATTRSMTSWPNLLSSLASGGLGLAGGFLGIAGNLAMSGVKFLGNAIGGLVGSGNGLMGMDRLAAGAAYQRRSARGLGVSVGAQSAFGINFGRFVDPDSFLGYISEAESNPAAATGMYTLGLRPTGNTETDSLAMMKAMRAWAKRTPASVRGLMGQALKLPGDTETWRLLGDSSEDEFNKQLSNYQTDKTKLNIQDPVGRKWQDFTSQLDRAGAEINKTFVTKLVPLEPSLENLSKGFIKLAETVANSGLVQKGIETISKWMTDFSNTINNSGFQSSVQTFVDDVGALADALSTVVGDKSARGTKGRFLAQLSTVEDNSGLPKGLLAYQFMRESGGSLNPADTKDKRGVLHVGSFQFDKATSDWLNNQYHKGHPLDPRKPGEASILASDYDQWLLQHYHGDVRNAIGAYNWGPTNMDAWLKTGRGANGQPMPDQTRAYMSGWNGTPSVRVEIYNHTGSDIVTTTAALAH